MYKAISPLSKNAKHDTIAPLEDYKINDIVLDRLDTLADSINKTIPDGTLYSIKKDYSNINFFHVPLEFLYGYKLIRHQDMWHSELSSLLRNLSENINSLQPALQLMIDFDNPGVYLAGGSITGAVFGKPSPDYDFFFDSNSTRIKFQRFLMNMGYEIEYVSFYTTTLIKSGETPLQLIHDQYYDTPELCIAPFDLTICQCVISLIENYKSTERVTGYREQTNNIPVFIGTGRWRRDASKRVISFNPVSRSLSYASFWRAIKYQDRYNMPINTESILQCDSRWYQNWGPKKKEYHIDELMVKLLSTRPKQLDSQSLTNQVIGIMAGFGPTNTNLKNSSRSKLRRLDESYKTKDSTKLFPWSEELSSVLPAGKNVLGDNGTNVKHSGLPEYDAILYMYQSIKKLLKNYTPIWNDSHKVIIAKNIRDICKRLASEPRDKDVMDQLFPLSSIIDADEKFLLNNVEIPYELSSRLYLFYNILVKTSASRAIIYLTKFVFILESTIEILFDEIETAAIQELEN